MPQSQQTEDGRQASDQYLFPIHDEVLSFRRIFPRPAPRLNIANASDPGKQKDRMLRQAGFIGILIALASLVSPRSSFADRPNVILCMADDLGWGDVGFNGNRIIQTPHLDRMASEALQLNRFYAAAPVCSPTRGSALTGRHPYRYGIFSANRGHLPESERSLAELLSSVGYVAGHFGKWHLGTLTREGRDANRGGNRNLGHFAPPWHHGFLTCFSTESKVPTWDPLLRPRGNSSRTWWNPISKPSDAEAYGTAYWDERGQSVTHGMRGDDSRLIMDHAIPFIQQAAKRGDPFLAVIWFHAPHLPVVAGPDYTKLYRDYPDYERHYYGCITALDEQIGRLRATLRSSGVADSTIVWFCSDNGPEGQSGKAPGSAGPFRGRKRDLLEGGIRVPALVEWPGRIAPGKSDFPACTLDYVPTVLELAGISLETPTRPQDGQSLVKLLRGEQIQRRPFGFQSADQLVWMDQQYKLIHRGRKPVRTGKAPLNQLNWQLYDIVKDPAEARDLSDRDPDRVLRMVRDLDRWRKSCLSSMEGKDYDGRAQ